MALCMFWKSEATDIKQAAVRKLKSIPIVHFKHVMRYSRCGRTPWVGQRGLGRS